MKTYLVKCFHYKNYGFKSYPIHVMSLSQAECSKTEADLEG